MEFQVGRASCFQDANAPHKMFQKDTDEITTAHPESYAHFPIEFPQLDNDLHLGYCPRCLEFPMLAPKHLGCGHTICDGCLYSLATRFRPEYDNEAEIAENRCPVCDRDIHYFRCIDSGRIKRVEFHVLYEEHATDEEATISDYPTAWNLASPRIYNIYPRIDNSILLEDDQLYSPSCGWVPSMPSTGVIKPCMTSRRGARLRGVIPDVTAEPRFRGIFVGHSDVKAAPLYNRRYVTSDLTDQEEILLGNWLWGLDRVFQLADHSHSDHSHHSHPSVR